MMDFLDTIKNLTKNTSYTSRFLSASEQAQAINYLKAIPYHLDGGYENAEYKRLYINTDPHQVVCFQISYNDRFLELSHQNILGSLMALNIERNTIGDIIPEQGVFFVVKELESVILRDFKAIGNHTINLKNCNSDSIQRSIRMQEYHTTVSSMRLDLVVSHIAGISRNEAKLWIENDLIKVNHIVVNKSTKEIQEEDILSIRKKGRFQILDSKKRSKKNKIVLIYGKFI